MATFTLTGNIDDLTGDDTRRITTLTIQPTYPISDPVTGIAWENKTRKKVTGGEFEWELPADSEPDGYGFLIEAPQLSMRWYVPQQAASTTVDLSEFTDVTPAIDPLISKADVDAVLAHGVLDSTAVASVVNTAGAGRTALDARYKVSFLVPPATGVAATDTAAINAQIALANALGGIVQLREGTYIINAALTALGNGVSLRGHGPYTTVIRQTSTTANFVTSSGSYLIEIRDLQFESLVTRTAGSAIALTNVEGTFIDNVRFIGCFNAGTFDGCHSMWMSRIKIAGGTGVTNRGFYWVSCVDTHITNVIINGGTTVFGAGKAWFHVDSGCDTWAAVDFGGASSSGAGLGLLVTHSLSPSSFAPRWIKATNFWFEGSSATVGQGSRGIEIQDCTNAYFTNGYVATSDSGIAISGGKDIRFSQVIVLNNWLYGAVVSGASGPAGVTFRDCTFDANSAGGGGAAPHLYLGGSTTGVRVRDCLFSNTLLGSANEATYAIESTLAVAADTQVSGCYFDATQYATGILGGGGSTYMRLVDNFGVNPKGSITAPTLPATTVAYTNQFGVDCMVTVTGGTVSDVRIGGVTTGLTSGTFRVPFRQTIAVHYTVAPTWRWFGD